MSPEPASLKVDLYNPADVQARLPEAKRHAASLRQEADQLLAKAESWDRVVHVLQGIADAAPSAVDEATSPSGSEHGSEAEAEPEDAPGGEPERKVSGPSSVAVAVGILEQTGGPMKVSEVHALAPQFTRKTIGWALWKAAKDGRIESLDGKGVYAPRAYKPELIFDSTNGGEP